MSEMKELKKQWKNHEFAKCYLFYGTETYLVKDYETALTKALLPPGAETMNYDIFEEKRATAAAVMDAAETLPFLNDKRLVVVKNSGFFRKDGRKEESERLKAFLADLPESVCLLFLEEKAEKSNGLYKSVVKFGQAVEFKRPTERELSVWIRKTCKDGGVTIADSVTALFLQTVDQDMENIVRELQKLIAYKGGQGEIQAEDVRAVCTVSLEAKVFDLVRAVAEKKPEKALQIYRDLLMLRESPYMVLSLIARQFRMILQSMLLSQSGMTNDGIAAKLELRDFAVRGYLQQSRRFSPEGWERALKDCLETDLAIKSGRMGEEEAVEFLILRYSRDGLERPVNAFAPAR